MCDHYIHKIIDVFSTETPDKHIIGATKLFNSPEIEDIRYNIRITLRNNSNRKVCK